MAELDILFREFNFTWPYDASKPTLFVGKTWVDTDKYDIVPKKGYIEKQIESHKNHIAYFEGKIKECNDSINKLKAKL